MRPADSDTIVAVSSPPGRSLRGLVRISGPDARRLLNELIDPSPIPPPRRLSSCRLHLEGRSSGIRHEAPLPSLATFLPEPRTYTAQDMAELQCPGNPALLDRLVHRVMDLGARLAEPGEFTFRAFLAGKLDLTEAEGVSATISARSDSQLQAARLLREGALGRFAAELVQEIGGQLALVEGGIDFVDQEDVVPIGASPLRKNLAALERRLEDLLAQSRSWGALEALPRVVLVGRPSAGKSTLFNALLGRRRAVIDSVPGTTRDVLAEPLTLRTDEGLEVEVMLVDMAGMDTPQGALDQQVQDAAHRAIKEADLILQIQSSDQQGTDFDTAAMSDAPVLVVRTKSDLGGNDLSGPDTDLSVSALTGSGLEELRREINARLAGRAVSISARMLALQPRHESALKGAAENLGTAMSLLESQSNRTSDEDHAIDQIELVAQSLRLALDELAALGGQMSPDDVLGRIFATFCIGK